MNKTIISIVIILVVSFFSGCAAKEIKKTHPPLREHPHKYPYTEVMGNYHVRLEVDHDKGEMFLIFEDIREDPIKLVRSNIIRGKVTFPDGSIKKITFWPIKSITRKHISRRKAGIYLSRQGWLKTTYSFVLDVTVPFKGQYHSFSFNYNK